MVCGSCKKSGYHKIADLKAHWHSKDCLSNDGWQQVIDARKAGNDGQAEKLIRKVLGIHHPMSKEAKEKLRRHNETHKDDIALKRKFTRQSTKRAQEKLTPETPQKT
jgi:hypothetical protein